MRIRPTLALLALLALPGFAAAAEPPPAAAGADAREPDAVEPVDDEAPEAEVDPASEAEATPPAPGGATDEKAPPMPRIGEPAPPPPPKRGEPPPEGPRRGVPPFAGPPGDGPGSPFAPGGPGGRTPGREAKPDRPPRPAAAETAAPPAPAAGTTALPTLEALTETRKRPLFVVGRRGPGPAPVPLVVDTGPAEPEEAPPPSALSLVLSGVVTGPGLEMAIFGDPAGGPALRLKIGDEHDGWKLTEVDRITARFRRGEETAELKLKPPGATVVAVSPAGDETPRPPTRRRPPRARPPTNPDGN